MILFNIINFMKERWTEGLVKICPFRCVYPAFLDHISPIEITSEQVMGRVLVIGQASAFPEKTLICTTESRYQELRSEVDTVYCCDTTYPSSPETHLNARCVNTVSYGEIPESEPGTVCYELSSCYEFLPRVKTDFFDTVLMFRVVDMGTQIGEQGRIPHLFRWTIPINCS